MDNVFETIEIDAGTVRLGQRKADSHKGDYGRVLIIGGSVGYTGAPVLSARAASKCGAGLVYVGVPGAVYDITAVKLDEEMPFPLHDEGGRIAADAESRILHRIEACDVCLIGPGLGVSDDVTQLVHSIVRKSSTALIIDADGLNALASGTDVLNRAACPLILTPHPGEFARLGGNLPQRQGGLQGESQEALQGDLHLRRVHAAADFAAKRNCILVLKGHRTITALPDGKVFVNTSGGPAMAKGGSGDVLAGMIAAFAGQVAAGSLGLSLAEAVCSAVFIHGLAGDMCADALGEYSVAAGDIIDMLPKAIQSVGSCGRPNQ